MNEWQQAGFDPDFEDREWTDDWLVIPAAPIPPGEHTSGYRVVRRVVQQIDVFGQPYRLAVPLDCRLLFDPAGVLWMSDTPQERIMMYNNGRRSRGHVLVGGLGLGLYPQYALAVGGANRFTVIERSPVIREIVEPTLAAVMDVPLDVRVDDVQAVLEGPVGTRYDTIFLDTWDTLDAANLPAINRLRDLALRHLAPGGRVLLWGYGWMLSLFEDACRQLLHVPPDQRAEWLAAQADHVPQAVALLDPVADYFAGQVVSDLDAALNQCRAYILRVSA